MHNIFLFIFSSILLTGCTLLPGMQNVDTTIMRMQRTPFSLRVDPIVIPITALYLAENPSCAGIYHVEPQDVLSIIVWQHPGFDPPPQQMALSATSSSLSAGVSGYLVNHKGDIYFPLIGNIHVAGKTVDTIRKTLTKKLRVYIRKPQVFVRVADFRSQKVYVLGEVLKPSVLPLNDQPMSITDAITLTGSFDNEGADPSHIYVIRGDFSHPEIFWLKASTPDALLLANQFYLQSNDIVVVSTAPVTRWNRVLSQLLPTVQTIWFTKNVIGK